MKSIRKPPYESSKVSYKPSGIEWLGEIPEHWEAKKLGDIVKISNGLQINLDLQINQRARGLGDCKGDKGNASQVAPLVPLIKAKVLPILDVKYLRNGSDKSLANSGNMVFANDRLILMDGENSGEIFIAKENGFLGSTLKKLDFSAIATINFMDYFLFSNKELFRGNKKGVAIPHLDKQLFLNLPIPLPPLEEQKAIAEFLDKKCDKISQFIESKQKLITLLQEKKQALINECVTKGLNCYTKHNVESRPLRGAQKEKDSRQYKNSGVEYLGTIPKHWEVRKLKYIVFSRNQRKDDKDFKIGLENIESKTGKYIPTNENVFEDSGISFYKNDILFGKLRPYLAKVFLADRDGICVSEFLVLESKEAYSNFLKFLMLSSSFIDIIDSSTYGTKMPRTSWEFVGNLKIPLPPLQEQKAIAEFLDTQITKIDLAIEKTKQQITYIKEYKTSLINQAVCGRIQLKD